MNNEQTGPSKFSLDSSDKIEDSDTVLDSCIEISKQRNMKTLQNKIK